MSGKRRTGLVLGRRTAAERPAIGFSLTARPKQSRELITYAGEGHLITFAPAGTGKTSGPVICNALTHPGQLIVLDVKGEVYKATADRRREMGQSVHVLDLRDGGMEGSLNPLDLAMRCGTDPAATARGFAGEMIERRDGVKDRFWDDWAETMITAGIAWQIEDNPAECRLSKLFDLYSQDDVTYSLARMLDAKKVTGRAAHAGFSSFIALPSENTRPSVLGSTQTHLRLFDSDLARRLTDTTSIDLDGLVEGKPISIYIIVPPYRLTAYRPLLRLWLSGLMLLLTRRTAPPELRTLMLCDEIGNLGRIDAFVMAAALMRSWGLTVWSFWQNPGQLGIYESQANTIVDNAGVIQVFGARNRRMAQEFSALVGGIEADDVLNMAADEQLLLIEGGKPIRCRQVRYYEEDADWKRFRGHEKGSPAR